MKRTTLAGIITAVVMTVASVTSPACVQANNPPPAFQTLEMRFSASQMMRWETETEQAASQASGLDSYLETFQDYLRQQGHDIQIVRVENAGQANGHSFEGEHSIQIKALPLRGLAPVENGTLYAANELETRGHEDNHAAAFAASPRDAIITPFGSKGLHAQQTVLNGSPVALIAKKGAKGEVGINTLGGKIYWQTGIREDVARSILNNYATTIGITGDDAYLKAENELSVKILQAGKTALASTIVTEAQAYFAMPLDDRADRQTLEEAVLASLPANKTQHVIQAKEAVSQVIEGYASLNTAGITGVNADIIMAQIAGKSMVLSDDEFAPYQQLKANIAMLFTQYGTPTPAEITRTLDKRRASNDERHRRLQETVRAQVEALFKRPVKEFTFRLNQDRSYTLRAN